MQQYAFTDPGIDRCLRAGALVDQCLKRGRGFAAPMAEVLAARRILALIQLRVEQGGWERFAMRFGRLHIELDGTCPPSLSPEEERYMPFLAPLQRGLAYLLRLLMYRFSRSATGWREWLRKLGHALLSEVGWSSLLPAWSPWAGRAPPLVPEVTLRQ
jgi:hypothetical protein